MAKVSHFKLGLFVLICGGVALAALIWIGAAQFFQHRKTYASYFNQSVAGLQPGAAVNYLGLRVGSVSSIALAPDQALIQVLLQIDTGFPVDSMAVSMAQAGITGQPYLALGKAPADIDRVTPPIPFKAAYPVIPNHPGEIQKLEDVLKEVSRKLDTLDLEAPLAAWQKAGDRLGALVSDPALRETLDNARAASADLKALVGGASAPGKPLQLRRGLEDLTATAAATREASQKLAAELASLPPSALADLTRRMEGMVQTGETAVGSWNRRVDQSLALFQDSVLQVNQVLTELRELVRGLRAEPGRVLQQPTGPEPFKR